jgi:hypothetical protein
MFKLGTPVSAFDIAQIVQTAMKDRGKAKAKPQASIIESLIEEALLEFTSLTDEQKEQQARNKESSATKPPTEGGAFVDPTNWADEFSSNDRPSQLGLGSLEVGNLSALEDESAGTVATDALLREANDDDPSSGGGVPGGPIPLAAGGAQAVVAQKNGGGVPGVVIALVVAVLAFGAAWFAHIIPH